jgi:hypothetical protein
MLTASDAAAFDYFGRSVSISGETAVVGADKVSASMGSAYVFIRDKTSWSEQAELTASDPGPCASGGIFFCNAFGWAVSLSGDTAVVGAPGDDHAGFTDAGSAYVFVRSGTSWVEQAKLTASGTGIHDWFGRSASLAGETALIGARRNSLGTGAAYVFVRSGTSWMEQAKLTSSDPAASDNFGISVSLSGDTAVVGDNSDDHAGGTDAGSAYVFVRSGTSWMEQAKLTASDAATGDRFGVSVSLSGDTAVVGADGDDNAGGTDAGSAYVFVRSGTSWMEEAKLTASDPGTCGGPFCTNFGYSVSLSGDTAVIGDPDDDAGGGNAGAAYVFVRSGTSWTEQKKLTASDATASDFFGISVSLSGDATLVGAYNDDHAGGTDAGSAYVCSVSNTYASTYCTAKVNSKGCLPAIRFSGIPSLTVSSPFKIIATSVINNKSGYFFYGYAPKSAAFQGGVKCVNSPIKRTPSQNSGGNAPPDDCSGVLTFDYNKWLDDGKDPSVSAGTKIYIQGWYRDPMAVWGTGLTNAVEFEVLP